MRRLAPALALVVLAVAGSGCGSTAKGPAGQFASLGCGSCHTLKAAGSHGSVGPNLDKLKPSVDAVEQQVRNGGGGMPSFGGRLSATQIHALAVYVSRSAGGR